MAHRTFLTCDVVPEIMHCSLPRTRENNALILQQIFQTLSVTIIRDFTDRMTNERDGESPAIIAGERYEICPWTFGPKHGN